MKPIFFLALAASLATAAEKPLFNGKLTVDVTDETAEGAKKGVLALQLHAGPPMQVEFKDIVLDAK